MVSGDDDHTMTVGEIDAWLTQIKKKIVCMVNDDWKASQYHRRFLRRLHNQQGCRDVFCLNYDTLLEASLDELRLPYVDGFRGTKRGWFDDEIFDEKNAAAYRIFKLHGSINWTRDTDGHVRRIDISKGNAETVVVYPSEQKYLQTQYGVYETLMGRFRNRLRIPNVNNHLIILGYSFNDAHVDEAIFDSINARGSNLTVIAFIGPENIENKQSKQYARLKEFSQRCDFRFNAFIGDANTGKFVGNAFDDQAVTLILKAELWKFERLVDFITEENP